MFHYLYYSVTINESEEKCKLFFFFISAMKSNIVPSSSSILPKKLMFWVMLVFVCIDKSMPTSLN